MKRRELRRDDDLREEWCTILSGLQSLQWWEHRHINGILYSFVWVDVQFIQEKKFHKNKSDEMDKGQNGAGRKRRQNKADIIRIYMSCKKLELNKRGGIRVNLVWAKGQKRVTKDFISNTSTNNLQKNKKVGTMRHRCLIFEELALQKWL